MAQPKKRKRARPKKPPITDLKDEYLKLKSQIRVLEIRAKEVEGDLLSRMLRQKKGKLKGTLGMVSLCTRVTTKYPESVALGYKALKEQAEKAKQVQYDSTSYLMVKLNK